MDATDILRRSSARDQGRLVDILLSVDQDIDDDDRDIARHLIHPIYSRSSNLHDPNEPIMNTPPVTPRRNRIRQSSPSSPSTPSTTFTATPIPNSTRPPVLPTRKRKSGDAGLEEDDEETVHPLLYLDRLGGSTDTSKTSGFTLSQYMKESERISRLPLVLATQNPAKLSRSTPTPNTNLIKSIAARVHTAQTCLPYLPSKINQGRDDKSKGQIVKLISTELRSYGGNLEGMGRGDVVIERNGRKTGLDVHTSRGRALVEEKETGSEMDIWDFIHERGLPRDMDEVEEWTEEWGGSHAKELRSVSNGKLKKEEREDGRTALGRKIKKTKVESGVSLVESTTSNIRTRNRTTNEVKPEAGSSRNRTTVQSSITLENIAQSLSIVTLQRSTTSQMPSELPQRKRRRSARGSGQSNMIGWTASKVSTGSGSVKSGRSGMKSSVLEGDGKDGEERNERVPIVIDVDGRQVHAAKEPPTIPTPAVKPSQAVSSATLPQHDFRPPAETRPHPIGTSLESPYDPVKVPVEDGNLGDDEMEPTQTDDETLTGKVGERGVEVVGGTVDVAAEDEQEKSERDGGDETAAHAPQNGMNDGQQVSNIIEVAAQGLDLSLTGLHDVSILEEGDPMAMDDVILFPPSFPEGLSTSTPKHLQASTAREDGLEDPPSHTPSPFIDLKRTPTKSSLPSPVRHKIAIDSDSEDDDHPLDPPSPAVRATKRTALMTSQASSSGPIPTSSFAQQPTQRVRDRADDTSRVALQILGMDVMDL